MKNTDLKKILAGVGIAGLLAGATVGSAMAIGSSSMDSQDPASTEKLILAGEENGKSSCSGGSSCSGDKEGMEDDNVTDIDSMPEPE